MPERNECVSRFELHSSLAAVWTFLTTTFLLTVDGPAAVRYGLGGLMVLQLLREIWLGNRYRPSRSPSSGAGEQAGWGTVGRPDDASQARPTPGGH